jgi:hypothetical protein
MKFFASGNILVLILTISFLYLFFFAHKKKSNYVDQPSMYHSAAADKMGSNIVIAWRRDIHETS